MQLSDVFMPEQRRKFGLQAVKAACQFLWELRSGLCRVFPWGARKAAANGGMLKDLAVERVEELFEEDCL